MNIQTLLKSKTRHRDDIDFKGIKKNMEEEFASVSVWQVVILQQHCDNKDVFEITYKVSKSLVI